MAVADGPQRLHGSPTMPPSGPLRPRGPTHAMLCIGAALGYRDPHSFPHHFRRGGRRRGLPAAPDVSYEQRSL